MPATFRRFKLAVESGNRQTSPDHRAEIGKEIEAFRAERDSNHEATSRSRNFIPIAGKDRGAIKKYPDERAVSVHFASTSLARAAQAAASCLET